MSYHLTDHIYIAQFRDELIVLDLKRDKYTVCSKDVCNMVLKAVDAYYLEVESDLNFTATSSRTSHQNMPSLQDLISGGLIEKKKSSFPFYIDRKIDSDGVQNVDWTLPLEDKKLRLTYAVIKAFLTLLKVNYFLKICGFYRTIRVLKRSRNLHLCYTIPSHDDLTELAHSVNMACLIFPKRTKCLEWAITFVLLALKKGWKCNLEIGVQNYPFMAHAWVECDENVIMDSQELRTGLGIILNEPFRKLKK